MYLLQISPKLNIRKTNKFECNKRIKMTVYSYVVDWEEMMNEPRLDLYSLDYDDANHSGTCEFTKTEHM